MCIEYKCDFCGNEIEKGQTYYGQYTYECERGEYGYDDDPVKIMLCEDCYSIYRSILHQKCYKEIVGAVIKYCEDDPYSNIPKIQEALDFVKKEIKKWQ